MGRIKGAIFDADGTLLDSMSVWGELGVRYLEALGVTPELGLAEILYPMSLEQSSSYLRGHYHLKPSPDEIKSGILAVIRDFYVNEVTLKPGVKAFLESMSLPKVIATSGDRELLTAALIRNGIEQYFQAIFTCSELQTDKNEARIFLECARFLGMGPENIAVFEDSIMALKTARDAGFITIGIQDDSNQHHQQEIMKVSHHYITDWRNFSIEDEDSIDNRRQ